MIMAAARSGRVEVGAEGRRAVEVSSEILRWWEGEAPDFRIAGEALGKVAAETFGRLGG